MRLKTYDTFETNKITVNQLGLNKIVAILNS